MASVAELKAAIDVALQQIGDGQAAVQAASEKLAEAQQTLAGALEGSGHATVEAAQASLTQAAQELEECLAATLAAVEQAQLYVVDALAADVHHRGTRGPRSGRQPTSCRSPCSGRRWSIRLASERLRWVRQESANPMGVPELSAATEHAGDAPATRCGWPRTSSSAYLAAIGLGRDGAPAAAPDRRPAGTTRRRPRTSRRSRPSRRSRCRMRPLVVGAGGRADRRARGPRRRTRPARSPTPRSCCAGWSAVSAPATGTGCTPNCAGVEADIGLGHGRGGAAGAARAGRRTARPPAPRGRPRRGCAVRSDGQVRDLCRTCRRRCWRRC